MFGKNSKYLGVDKNLKPIFEFKKISSNLF